MQKQLKAILMLLSLVGHHALFMVIILRQLFVRELELKLKLQIVADGQQSTHCRRESASQLWRHGIYIGLNSETYLV